PRGVVDENLRTVREDRVPPVLVFMEDREHAVDRGQRNLHREVVFACEVEHVSSLPSQATPMKTTAKVPVAGDPVVWKAASGELASSDSSSITSPKAASVAVMPAAVIVTS